jgi:predicted CoA-binding protein
MKKETVAILGASDNPDRYAYKALKMLEERGHTPIPVHPTLAKVEKYHCLASLAEITQKVDTLTLYVNPSISSQMIDAITKLKPSRVILNPGTENPILEKALTEHGIAFEHACTLVLLSTGQY